MSAREDITRDSLLRKVADIRRELHHAETPDDFVKLRGATLEVVADLTLVIEHDLAKPVYE